ALRVTGSPLPPGVVERFRRDAVRTRWSLPPGLYDGAAGVAWVLAELGLLDEAVDVLAAAGEHPVMLLSASLGAGVAGVGMAYLSLFHRTTDPCFLTAA